MDLLPRLHNAKTVRIVDPMVIEAELELGFGIKVVRQVRLEGLDQRVIPASLKNAAMHALVVLIGGKKIVVQASPDGIETVVVGRVYLEKVSGDPPGMSCPPGASAPMLEISEFMRWLSDKKFAVGNVLSVLNGK